MRLRATSAGIVPIVGPRQAPAQPERRTWLKRLGAVFTGAALARTAAAAPRQVTGANPFVGEIMLFAGTFAPVGWAFCDGSLQSIAQNTTLFTLIGTTYGGDGVNTFALPDLRGRAPRHFNQGPGLSPYVIGQVGGTETQTLTTNQMPQHTHNVGANDTPGSNSPVNAVPAALVGTDVNGEIVSVLGYGTPPSTSANASTVQASGSGLPFSIMSPSLVMNYCIAIDGIYPSQ